MHAQRGVEVGPLTFLKCTDRKESPVTNSEESELHDAWNIILAARRGDIAEIEALIDEGFKGTWSKLGVSPLVAAVEAGHGVIVKVLIRLGLQLDQPLHQGKTALAVAASNGMEDLVPLLIEAGAEINLADDNGVTPLMLAAKHGKLCIVKMFLSRPDLMVDQVDFSGKSALAHAAASGNVQVAEVLLNHRANLNVQDQKGDTILSLATKAGCLPMVELLLKFGAEIDVPNNQKFTALM